jgi:hypothetical protein
MQEVLLTNPATLNSDYSLDFLKNVGTLGFKNALSRLFAHFDPPEIFGGLSSLRQRILNSSFRGLYD